MWSGMTLQTSLRSAEGELRVEALPVTRATDVVCEMRVSGRGKIRDLVLAVSITTEPREIFLAAPNFNGISVAHPAQTLYQGLSVDHRDALFGPQWMYSPPPLVFPIRSGDLWYGVGLGAAPGRNLYSGWSYVPRSERAFDLCVHYDGYVGTQGHLCSVFFLADGKRSPHDVIHDYAELLRRLGWAPRPTRDPAPWWSGTFFFPWGEQCNLARQKRVKMYYQGDAVTMYETQANQLRWFSCVADRGVPVGTVCTSDKWQLERQRLLPDTGKYTDMRGFVDFHHAAGRHVLSWVGLWRHDNADQSWCLRDSTGATPSLDPESEGYGKALREDVERLISPRGYDFDGFFLDFTNELPVQEGLGKAGDRWGVELLHFYLTIIHDAAKNAKKDALIMTHCPHPYFADVTDVLRLNDWSFKKPDLVAQARYRRAIAAACSDWLINTDNWFMYDIDQWREYLGVAPELGIPASWYATGVWGDGPGTAYEAFTDGDYARWKEIWTRYSRRI